MIDTSFISSEKIIDLEISSGNDIVMTKQDPSDGAEKDLVRGEERDEDTGGVKKVPGICGKGDDSADEKAFSNSQIFRK